MGGDRQKEELKGEGRCWTLSALCNTADTFTERSTSKVVSLKPQQLHSLCGIPSKSQLFYHWV